MRHAITSLNHNIAPLSSFILRGNSTLFTLPKNATPHRMTHLIRRESACQCPLSQDKFSIIEPFFFNFIFQEIVASHQELRCPECRVLVEIKIDELPPNVLLMRILEGKRTRIILILRRQDLW